MAPYSMDLRTRVLLGCERRIGCEGRSDSFRLTVPDFNPIEFAFAKLKAF
jgi:hypothetical protein